MTHTLFLYYYYCQLEQIHSDISNRLERKYCSKTVKEFEETYEISHCQISGKNLLYKDICIT